VVLDAASDSLLGACDVRLVDREDPRIGELGYLLSPAARGRGVMTSALRLLISWSFSEPLSLERLQAMTHVDNDRSMRLLERLGFAREGLLRGYRPSPGGGREDRVVWSLLAIDWPTS
jgi:ribosomal-protein-serine acetyltransferase